MDGILNFWKVLPFLTQLFVAFIFLATLLFHLRFSQKAVSNGPTILTTIGILATFLGIAFGLQDFDSTNLQDSVPKLLGGLKTAFWGSVFGVAGAITIKLRYYLLGVPKTSSTRVKEDASVSDLLLVMQEMHYSLAGEEDSTLLSQMKLSRQDSNDRLDALKKAQTEALEKLSQMGSAALIEALRDVIRDFNKKLSEQFGENFKQLNEGVAKLLVWQQQYMKHIEVTSDRLETVVGQSNLITANHATMNDHASNFSKTASDLSVLLSGLETQKQQFTVMLTSLADLLAKSSSAIPEIQDKIVAIAGQLSNSFTTNQKVLSEAITENSATIRRNLETSSKETERAQIEYSRHISEMVTKSKDQIELLDAQLGDELTKSLESLGRQLSALSEKFVSDYTPLTDRLREVVRIASRVQ
jgi:hypothetical protein